jgi:hypothetical protein
VHTFSIFHFSSANRFAFGRFHAICVVFPGAFTCVAQCGWCWRRISQRQARESNAEIHDCAAHCGPHGEVTLRVDVGFPNQISFTWSSLLNWRHCKYTRHSEEAFGDMEHFLQRSPPFPKLCPTQPTSLFHGKNNVDAGQLPQYAIQSL